MAKITITIEDFPGDKVKVVSDPSFENMVKLAHNGSLLTAAHGYAFLALNAIRSESKKRDSKLNIILPRALKN